MVKPIHPTAAGVRPPRPLVSLCVMFRDNISTLRDLLVSVRDHFDEYVFLDTGSVDGSRDLIEGFLREDADGKGKIVDFEWCDDFAKARQANFEAASGTWRMFLDSDDVLRSGENLRAILTKIAQVHPHVQGFFVNYDYDVLETLPTMRLVRWTRAWSWKDAIHERLESLVPLQPDALASLPADDLSVRHKRKTLPERDSALRRNGVIARREYATTTDLDYRARLARTIAMELKLDGKFDDARPYLDEVAERFPTLPEGRQAFADLFRFAIQEKDFDVALQHARRAGPSYETLCYNARGEHAKAVSRGAVAMVAGQQTTHEGFLFEKVLAPVAVAESALALGYHPSRVERVLNTVRPDLRVHDAAVGHVSSIRAAIDRITILVPNTPQPFDGSSTDAMLGGSEEAVVYLTRALAEMGRNVRVFGVLPPTTLPGPDSYGVDWQPFSAFKLNDEHGCLVTWRATGLIAEIMRTKGRTLAEIRNGREDLYEANGIGAASLWLHDRGSGVDPAVFARVVQGIDSVVVLSDHHRQCIERELPPEHRNKFVTLSNGIVGDDFLALMEDKTIKRDPNRVIYSSCPSRGLSVLLKQWPTIKAACPEAYLDIYYDWSMLRDFQPDVYRKVVADYEAVRHLDVKHHGGVSHAELHLALRQCNVWAYSHYENTDVETFCISAVKATAAGATVVTAPNGALPEVAPEAIFVPNHNDYEENVIIAIQYPETDQVRKELSDRAIARFDWRSVAEAFSKEWTSLKACLR
jgi:glycosyltransferase involved in cell wall biosynthesis